MGAVGTREKRSMIVRVLVGSSGLALALLVGSAPAHVAVAAEGEPRCSSTSTCKEREDKLRQKQDHSVAQKRDHSVSQEQYEDRERTNTERW